MTSNHRHGKSVFSVAGDTDARILDLQAKYAALRADVDELLTPVTPPPVIPPGTDELRPDERINGRLLSGSYVMHAGTYRFGCTANEVSSKVSLQPYGDGPVIIDGTGLDPHFVYLGPGAEWTIGNISIVGFSPSDSGVIGIGDGCSLSMKGTVMRFGSGAMTAGAAQNRHLVYFHGTGVGHIEDCDLRGAPGAALQSYRGNPVVRVEGGYYSGTYRGSLIYSGSWTINDAYLAGTGTGIDAEHKPGMLTLNRCTGPAGAVRTYVA